MLNDNAMTTVQECLLYQKKYIPVAVTGKALTASLDNKTFTFPNSYLIPSAVAIHETVGQTVTDITASATINYESGIAVFSAAHTGTVTADYTYLSFNFADNYIIEHQINAVSDYIEKYCNRKFGLQTYTDEPYTGCGRQIMQLNQWPVTELTSVKMSGTLLNVPEYTMSVEDAKKGWIFAPNGWSYDGALVGYVGEPLAPYRSYLITYTAGYVLPKDATTEAPRTLPYDLEGACKELISAKLAARGIENVKQEHLGDASEAYFEDDLPPAIKAVLDRYRRRE